MNTWAVSFIDFLDNELKIKVVNASNWKEALNKAFPGFLCYLSNSNDLQIAKAEAFNQAWIFEAIQIIGE